jgi:hypothetical protein
METGGHDDENLHAPCRWPAIGDDRMLEAAGDVICWSLTLRPVGRSASRRTHALA